MRKRLVLFTLVLPLTGAAQILTAQYDSARTGATLVETKLTPANVRADRFGKLFSLKVDGDFYAQPLFIPRVEIPGKGTHDVVFVATEHDSVYAFDSQNSPSAPAYWNGRVYVLPSKDYLTSLAVENKRLAPEPQIGEQRFGNPGATPAISANGARDGILWLIETKSWNGADRPAILHAYDAANVVHELYSSEQNSARDRAGLTLRFTVPTIANGRVYVDAKREIDVYGLLSQR